MRDPTAVAAMVNLTKPQRTRERDTNLECSKVRVFKDEAFLFPCSGGSRCRLSSKCAEQEHDLGPTCLKEKQMLTLTPFHWSLLLSDFWTLTSRINSLLARTQRSRQPE